MEVLRLNEFDWSPRRTSGGSAHMFELSERFSAHTLGETYMTHSAPTPSLPSPARRSYTDLSTPLRRTSSTDTRQHPFPQLELERASHQHSSIPSRRPSMSTASIRRQRQRAIRHQCSSSHLLEVKNLIARMVANGEIQDLSPSNRLETPNHSSNSTRSNSASPEDTHDSRKTDVDEVRHSHTSPRKSSTPRITKQSSRPNCRRKKTG